MSLRLYGTISPKNAGMMNAHQLAYIGDSVWETIVRDTLIHRGMNVHHMHGACVTYVNAHAQAGFLQDISDMLDDMETDIVRRGRNAHPHHHAPKNQDPGDYAASTGFEALIGYLYLTGQEERIMEISKKLIGGIEDG